MKIRLKIMLWKFSKLILWLVILLVVEMDVKYFDNYLYGVSKFYNSNLG